MKLLILLLFAFQSLLAEDWTGFDFEEMGLTRQEFKILKNSPLSKEQFYELLLIGVLPSDYLAKPWEKLHVSEAEWLEQRKQGMTDEDIDLSWQANSRKSYHAWASLALPGWYQYREQQYWKGVLANSLNAMGLISVATMHYGMKDPDLTYPILLTLLGNLYSFTDAYIQLPSSHKNNDLDHFSYYILPHPDFFVAQMQFSF